MTDTLLTKLDSNQTSLRYALESSLGVLPTAATQNWFPLEPNTYQNYGAQIKTVARQPISASRQIKKGTIVDVDASGGLNSDITQTNLQDLLQGFFFAAAIQPPSNHGLNTAAIPFTSTSSTGNKFSAASGLAVFKAGFLVVTAGFANTANNGLQVITTGNTATFFEVAATLVSETVSGYSPTADVCGFQFASGDAAITESGIAFPVLSTSSQDLTALGLVAGQWIFIGGDTSVTKFATAADNGFARVLAVSTHAITLDRTSSTIVTDAGTSKTIQIFFGTVLQNQQGTNIVRRSYHLERTLGAYDATQPTLQQAEYLVGAIPDQFSIVVATASKVTADLTFVALNSTSIDEVTAGANTLLSHAAVVAGGTAPAIVDAAPFNTSNDVPRINLSVYTAGTSNTTPLFAFVQDMTVTIKNNLKPNKAIGVLGAFEVTAGFFQITGKATVYFAEIEAIQSLLANANACLDAHFVNNNAGMSLDLPLLTLGDGRPNVALNEPITLPLNFDGASGAFLDSRLNYSALVEFYSYLPTAAQ